MKFQLLLSLWAASTLADSVVGPNQKAVVGRDVPVGPNHKAISARQDIDFDLIDSSPDPATAPDNSANYDPSAALAAAIAQVSTDPLPQSVRRRTAHERRSIQVSTYSGYTDNLSLGTAAINAPLDCAGKDTYMGVKIFTMGTFDTKLCAAACTSQSEYNVKHPPSTGSAKTCQFYQTFASYKNGVYEGQYCAMYTAAWDVKYATNVGQWRGEDHYTIQDSYIATNLTSNGVNTNCRRSCSNPYWGNSVSCGVVSSRDGQTCWCNQGMDGIGYCTEDEIDGISCTKDADCGPGGICMDQFFGGGTCALGPRVAACSPGTPL